MHQGSSRPNGEELQIGIKWGGFCIKGVNKLSRNAETFSPLGSTSLPEPEIKSIVLGTPDSNGGIVEGSDETR